MCAVYLTLTYKMWKIEIFFTTYLRQRRPLINEQNRAPLRTYCTHTGVAEYIWAALVNERASLCLCVCMLTKGLLFPELSHYEQLRSVLLRKQNGLLQPHSPLHTHTHIYTRKKLPHKTHGSEKQYFREELYSMYGKWHPLPVFICEGSAAGD